MKKLIISLVILLTIVLNNFTQYYPIIQDDFSDDTKFYDLSVLVTLSGESGPVSAFELAPKADNNTLSFNSIQLTADAIGQGGYGSGYNTHTSIDYEIPEFDRASYEDYAIRVEFDLLWHEVSGGSGNSGKLQLFAIHEYPEG